MICLKVLQATFTNREIAIGSWVLLIAIILLFTKPAQQFLKTSIPIYFARNLFFFYIVFLSFFGLTIYGLFIIGFWKVELLKDTIFWVFLIELPLFVKKIDKAKDSHFFAKLIKNNITLIVIIEFLLGFWTFGLVAEFIIFPVTLIFGIVFAIVERNKNYNVIKRFFIGLFLIWIIILIANFIINVIRAPEQLFTYRH